MILVIAAEGCRDARTVDYYLQSGRQYLQQDKYDGAAIQFENALQKEPENWEAEYYSGITAGQLHRLSQAYRQLSIAISLQPSFVPARLAFAQLLLADQRTKEAREQINAALELDSKNPEAHLLLARAYLAEQDFPHAIEKCEETKALSPQQSMVWAVCGFARISDKQYELAVPEFRRALELDSASAENYRNLVGALRLTKREAEAESILCTGVADHRNSQDLHLVLTGVTSLTDANNFV